MVVSGFFVMAIFKPDLTRIEDTPLREVATPEVTVEDFLIEQRTKLCKETGGEEAIYYYNSGGANCINKEKGKEFEFLPNPITFTFDLPDEKTVVSTTTIVKVGEFIETEASKVCSPYINSKAIDIPARCVEYIKDFYYY